MPASRRTFNARARVIVISSTGKHFSAGMDLSVFAPQPNTKIDGADKHVIAEMFRSNVKRIQHSFNALEEARIPVLFALQGGGIGGAAQQPAAVVVEIAVVGRGATGVHQ